MNVKAITFDLGGTLIESEMNIDGYNEALHSFLKVRGNEVDLGELRAAIDAAMTHLSEVQAEGREMTFEEVYGGVLERLSINVDDSSLIEMQRIFKAHSSMTVDPKVDQLLKNLSLEYKLGMISNTIHNVPRDIIVERAWDRYFAAVVVSRDVGYRKPRPEIFKHALDLLGVKAEEAMHVGDRIDADIEGALGVGMIPVWVSKNRRATYDGYIIENVCDLSKLLKNVH